MSTRPSELAPMENARFGRVGPGTEANHRSHTAYSCARVERLGRRPGPKHFMTRCDFRTSLVLPSYAFTNPCIVGLPVPAELLKICSLTLKKSWPGSGKKSPASRASGVTLTATPV